MVRVRDPFKSYQRPGYARSSTVEIGGVTRVHPSFDVTVSRSAVGLAPVFAIAAGTVSGAYPAYRPPERERTSPARSPSGVTVIKPSRMTIEDTVTAPGSVEASRTVRVITEPGSRPSIFTSSSASNRASFW